MPEINLRAIRQTADQIRLLRSRPYTPHAKQAVIAADHHRFKVIRCGRRFGKTLSSTNTIIEQAVLKGGDYWFVAPTYRQAKEIAWRVFGSYLPEQLIAKKNETDLSFELINKARISLKGADNPDSLRGVGLNGVVMDEYAFTDPYAWEVISPILQDRRGWATFISTPNGYNHFYQLAQREITDPDYKSFHFTSYDNPYLDPAELDKERERMSAERFAQEYLAEFNKKSGAVWPAFSRDYNLVPRRSFDPNFSHFMSIDFGFAIGHPTALLLHEVDDTGLVYTGDGFLQEGLNIDRIDELMRLKSQGLLIRGVYYDPARPDLAAELSSRGWPMLPAKKDVELGIAKVDEYLRQNPQVGRPKWVMANHLIKEIEQLEGYVWQELRVDDGRYKQVPKKQADDACDALRYFLYTYTDRPAIAYDDDDRQPLEFTGYVPVGAA